MRLAKHKQTGQYFALKMMKKAEIVRLKQVDHVISEMTILFAINHPFLVQFHGFNRDAAYLYLLQEHVPGGELYAYMKSEGKLAADTVRYVPSHDSTRLGSTRDR